MLRFIRHAACVSLTLLTAACDSPDFAAYALSTLNGRGFAASDIRFIEFIIDVDVDLPRDECPSLAGAVATVNGATALLAEGGYDGGGLIGIPGSGSGSGCSSPRVQLDLDETSADAAPVTELVISGAGGEIRFSSPGLLQETKTALSIRGGGTAFAPGDTIIVDHTPSGDVAIEPITGSLVRALSNTNITVEPVLQQDGSLAVTVPTSPRPPAGQYSFTVNADYGAEVLECAGVASCSYVREREGSGSFVIDVLP